MINSGLRAVAIVLLKVLSFSSLILAVLAFLIPFNRPVPTWPDRLHSSIVLEQCMSHRGSSSVLSPPEAAQGWGKRYIILMEINIEMIFR